MVLAPGLFGTPGTLTADLTDPVSSSARCLGDLIVCGGSKFNGLTTQALLDNATISGNVYALVAHGATVVELDEAVRSVNGNFEGSESNNGFLCLP